MIIKRNIIVCLVLFAEVYVCGMDRNEINVDPNGIKQPNVTENKNIPIKKEEGYYRWEPDFSKMPLGVSMMVINEVLMEQAWERRNREKDQKK